MSQLVEFALENGGEVLVQVHDTSTGPVTRGLDDHAVTRRAQQTFEQAIDRLQPAAQALLGRLRAFGEVPEEVRVEFGIQLNAQAGAVIAAASTTANFTVVLTWRHPHPLTTVNDTASRLDDGSR
jgi:hypothetical protein